MTRLRTGDIADIAENLEEYDAELVLKTGCTLLGMPTGLNAGALKKLSGRYLHDPLQIGVATMIVEAAGESGN